MDAKDLLPTDVLKLGDISRCQVAHTRGRAIALHNCTIQQARRTLCPHPSGAVAYPTYSDIRYLVKQGNVTAHRSVDPHAMMATPKPHTSTNTNEPPAPNTTPWQYNHGWTTTTSPNTAPQRTDNNGYVQPRTTRATFIDEASGRDIAAAADADPFILQQHNTFSLELEVDDTTTHYNINRNHQPHAFAATHELPPGNLVIASQGQFHKLRNYRRHADIAKAKAICAEYNGFDDRGVWECVPAPPDEKLHRSMLLIKVKTNSDGTENKVKARCVIMGNRMEQGVHYTDTHAPTTGMVAARCLLSSCVTYDRECVSTDAKQAFCNAIPEYDTYLEIPPGKPMKRTTHGQPMCMKLKRQTYGIPNGPRRWHIVLHNWLLRYNANNPDKPQWTQSALEPCLYHLRGKCEDERVDMCVFVDDFLSCFPKTENGRQTYSDFIEAFKKDYDLQDDGYQRCTEFTGMRLTWHPDGSLAIDQPGCVSSILHKYGHWDCRPAFIPALANTPIKLSDCPADGPDGDADRAFMKDKPYREVIGDLLWIARVFRFDIQYAVNACSRVAHKPGPAHWHAVCHILRYLNHTRDYQLIYAKPTEPDDHTIGFTDSDYAPAYGTEFDNYRSTSGNIISHNRHALMWKSRRQDRAAQSSTEAEYYAAASAAKDLLYTSQLMKSLAPHR
ncbi:MAG TPA: hypothetical protein EYN66_20195, partial [Myxococcales bacterium]|nr:hypothetical protein [Myxococcales bacterium]